MKTLIKNLLHRFTSWWRERWYLSLENLALRHQHDVLKRSGKRPQFSSSDRCFWLFLADWWPTWPQALEIMQADTVRRWRRQGIWHHLKWRRGRKRPGRPPIPAETRKLIYEMSRDNRLWGAPRIRGELLKRGIKVSPTTVAKYMIPRTYRPSPTWRAFIRNQVPDFVIVEVYAAFSRRFRAVSSRSYQLFRRWFRWFLLHWQQPADRGFKRLRPQRNNLFAGPIIWVPSSNDPVKVSGRSPPGVQESSPHPMFDVRSDGSMEIGLADARSHSSVMTRGAGYQLLFYAPELDDKEQRLNGSQQSAA